MIGLARIERRATMPTKLQYYVQMAEQTANNLTRNLETWIGFLTTVSKQYKFDFASQLLIYAQNKQATAVACFDTWTKKMGRYIRRGTKGIALIDTHNRYPRVYYVFDVLSTGQKKDSTRLYLWQYREEYRNAITTALEKHYGIPCNNGFPEQLEDIATKLAENYWQDYGHQIMYDGVGGSMMEELDELNVSVKFRNVAGASIAYALLSRCDLHPEKRFRVEDFQDLCDFNTQHLIQILGTAVSQASGQVLSQIAKAIFNYECDKAQSSHNSAASQNKTGNTQDEKPTIPEIYAHFKPVIREFVLNDKAYQNACKNSDKENAELEFKSAIKRAAFSIKDLKFLRIHYDLSECHNQMQKAVFAETYPMLSFIQEKEPQPAIPEVIQEDTPANEQETEMEENAPNIAEPEPTDTAGDSSEPAPDTNCTTLVPIQVPNPVPDSNQEIEVRELPNPTPAATNFHITDDQLGIGGSKAKFRKNMDAITTLKQIEAENRTATPEEQQVLSQYVGWGGIPDAFDQSKADWATEYQELKAALTPDEYTAARASTLNAHYTSPVVIKAIYEAISNMGFHSGNILEPAIGIGNFFGMLPENMQKSKLYGVELDNISGRIAKQLYPTAKISVCGYENTNFPNNFFDLAIGNVPFGQYKVDDAAYNKLGFSIHNYFIAKALDQVRPGGILAIITSRYTMDAKEMDVRKYLAERADLLGAIRLPNNAFKANAGTDVLSDILFLQKRNTPAVEEPAWVQTAENTDGFAINRYFIDNPDMVLGNETSESTRYGRDYTVSPIPDADLATQLHEAVSHIHGSY